MKRQTVVLVALAVPLLCAGIVGITMVTGIFRARQTTDAEPRFVGSASWTNPVPASPAAISNALVFSVESFRMDDGTVTARHDGRTPFDSSAWKPGMQHPVVPDPGLPDVGTNTLRAVLGQSEEWYVYNAVCGLYLGSPERIPYERTGDTTVLHFPSDWDVRIDNATGAILEPTGLPPLSERELSDLTWAEISRERGVERWMEVISTSAASAGKRRRLTGFRLDEIRFVGDKAFVAWRLMDDPPSADGFLRLTYWVDRRTKRIVHSGTEVHEDR